MRGLALMALSMSWCAAVPAADFTGRWTIQAAPAESTSGRGSMGSGWGSTISIAQDAGRLTVEYSVFGRGDMQPPLRFVYALDGSETRNSVMMGRGIQGETSKTAWDGEKLIITTVHGFADPTSGKPMTQTVKRTLWLETPGTLVVETTRSGVLGGPSSTTRTVYTKS